jgi:hypothetical protein
MLIYYKADISFIGGGNRSTPSTCSKSQTNLITYQPPLVNITKFYLKSTSFSILYFYIYFFVDGKNLETAIANIRS